MFEKTVIYVAVGDLKYHKLVIESVKTLRKYYDGHVVIVTDNVDHFSNENNLLKSELINAPILSKEKYSSREIKTTINRFTKSKLNLYLDADTLIYGSIDEIWNSIEDTDMSLALDVPPGTAKEKGIWQCEVARSLEEKEFMTKMDFKDERYFNSGVILWKNNEKTEEFFKKWNEEWNRYKRIDQPSLVRAVNATNLKISTLPTRFNHMPFTKSIEPPVIWHFWEALKSGNV